MTGAGSEAELHEYAWRVIVYIDERDGKQIRGAVAPHRAAAKQYVAEQYELGGVTITGWEDCYVPRATWDCPVCGTNEAMTERLNMRGDHDWECMVCFSRAWGEPMEFNRIEEGGYEPTVTEIDWIAEQDRSVHDWRTLAFYAAYPFLLVGGLLIRDLLRLIKWVSSKRP